MKHIASDELDRRQAVAGLRKLRIEWSEATDGMCLESVNGSVALLLEDAIEAIGLSCEERNFDLGKYFHKSG